MGGEGVRTYTVLVQTEMKRRLITGQAQESHSENAVAQAGTVAHKPRPTRSLFHTTDDIFGGETPIWDPWCWFRQRHQGCKVTTPGQGRENARPAPKRNSEPQLSDQQHWSY